MIDCRKSRWHLPRPTKACCCFPLRRGIIIVSYLNLLVVFFAYFGFVLEDHLKWFLYLFRHNQQERLMKQAQTKLTVFSYLIIYLGGILAEIVMIVVNLVGLHRKKLKLIRAYLHFTSVYTALITVTRGLDFQLWTWPVEVTIIITFLCFKIYFILMLRSQVKKMEHKEKESEIEHELNTVNFLESKLQIDIDGDEEHSDDNLNSDDTLQLIEDVSLKESQKEETVYK